MLRAIPLVLAGLAALGACHAAPPPSAPLARAEPSAKPSRPRPAAHRAAARPLPVRCTAAVADVYAATLPSEGVAPERGAILRCAEDTPLAPADVDGRLARARVTGLHARTGARVFRIAYATRRRGERPGVGTALVYLPEPPPRGGSDVAVVSHGTAGVADRCAPSIPATTSDYLALPWLAHGFAVVAPDYAGLGNAGVQGYGDWEDTAHSALDASRAIRALAGPSRFGTKDVYVGHSQGAGASLAAQALAPTYGGGGRVAAVVAFAPAFSIDADVTPIAFPFVSTSALGGGPATILSLHFYGFFANRYGEAHRGDGFAPAHREAVVEALERDCVFELLGSVPRTARSFGELFDPTFRAEVLACANGRGCEGPGGDYVAFLRANVLSLDPAGAPILHLQGLHDAFVAPVQAACLDAKLERDGVHPTVCADDSDHMGVVWARSGHAIAWARAILDGTEPPPCPTEDRLPECPIP